MEVEPEPSAIRLQVKFSLGILGGSTTLHLIYIKNFLLIYLTVSHLDLYDHEYLALVG